MLSEYGLAATFYISPWNQEFAADDLLTPRAVSDISSDFEIGAHTLTHRSLPTISEEEAAREVAGSKAFLEQITGSPVTSFCYPRGAYTELHVEQVRAAGYRYARTVTRYAFNLNNPLEAGTSLHVFNYGWGYELLRTARFARFRPVASWRCLDWGVLGRAMFDLVRNEGGIFHIWGHSWEVDKNNDWQRLEAFFRYISGHPEIEYVPNGDLCSSSAGEPRRR
jgi:peptidoglycan-N-acetylglucosamine deacetylase